MNNKQNAPDPYKKILNFQNAQKPYDSQYYGQIMNNVVQDNKNLQVNQKNISMKAIQIQQLQSMYRVKEHNTSLSTQMKQVSYVVEIPLKDQIAFIKISLDHNFPDSPPRLHAMQYLEHSIINDKTWEIDTTKFHPWNNQSQIKDLIQLIHNEFTKESPQPDPFILEINFLKTKVIEDKEITKMKEKDLALIFPNVKPEQYKDIIEGQQISEYIFKLPEYQTLAKYVVELVEVNEKLAYSLIDRNMKLTQHREELKQLAQYYDSQTNELVIKFEQCKLIKERFDKTKVLSLLESEISRLDEISGEKLEGVDGTIQIVDGNQDKTKFEDQVQEYLELRKKYHRLLIKKEKFAEIM